VIVQARQRVALALVTVAPTVPPLVGHARLVEVVKEQQSQPSKH
jgi:hypothetical protein